MEGIRGIQHPLQTPIILECIFKNLGIHDLQGCRQVCRSWRQESGKAMRAVAKVEINCSGLLHRGPTEFLELVKNDESTFFQAPFADTITLKDGVADCPEFWERCGAKIKRLRLDDVTFSSADAFRHAIFQCCPNLEKLEVEEVQVLGEPTPEPNEWVAPQFAQNRNLKSLSLSFLEEEKAFGASQLEILRQFPCLEKLRAVGTPDHFENVLRALEIARRHDPSSWKLNEVAMGVGISSTPLPSSFARVFGDRDLTLKSLSIYGIARDIMSVTAARNVLVAHAHSLKKLEINQSYGDARETDIFPLPGNQILENVEVLKLIMFKIRSTRFLQAFPSLKKLMLDVDEIPEDTQTPHVTLDDCTQLYLFDPVDQIDNLKRIVGLLPNLKKLKVRRLDNEQFSLICANWPDLTHLELGERYQFPGLRVDDVGISGYDREDVVKINQMERGGSLRPITVRRANLSCLKNLQSFSCRFNYEAYSTGMGYCSEACGILELPNLKHLRMDFEDRTGYGRILVPMFESLSEQFPWDDSQEITID